jgi:Fe-S-cluster containining protein
MELDTSTSSGKKVFLGDIFILHMPKRAGILRIDDQGLGPAQCPHQRSWQGRRCSAADSQFQTLTLSHQPRPSLCSTFAFSVQSYCLFRTENRHRGLNRGQEEED